MTIVVLSFYADPWLFFLMYRTVVDGTIRSSYCHIRILVELLIHITCHPFIDACLVTSILMGYERKKTAAIQPSQDWPRVAYQVNPIKNEKLQRLDGSDEMLSQVIIARHSIA